MKSVGLKKRPKKNLRISVKSVGQNFHRIFAELWPLANGSRQICAAIVFGHADFADDADFFRGRVLSHRFHRYTQIFFMESLVNRFVRSQGVSFLRGIIFVPQISQIYTDFFESQANRFVRSQGVSATTGQVASAKIRE